MPSLSRPLTPDAVLPLGGVGEGEGEARGEQAHRTPRGAQSSRGGTEAILPLPMETRRTLGAAPAGRRMSRPDRQAWALAHLRAAGPLTPRAYARAMAVSADTAVIDLRELLARGLVRAEGTTEEGAMSGPRRTSPRAWPCTAR
jgi:hypothetical protein